MRRQNNEDLSGFYDDSALLRLEQNTQEIIVDVLKIVKNANARRHLHEGLWRRVGLIEHSRIEIREAIGYRRVAMLHRHEAEAVTVHVNAFYANVCGGLDNLAWALMYELLLLANPKEDDLDTRRFCVLFGKPFLAELFKRREDLVALIEKNAKWNSELREFRDPGAHRIPLYVPPGVIEPSKQNEYSDLIKRAISGGRLNHELLAKADSLVHFEEIVVMSGPNALETQNFTKQMVTDELKFLKLATAILRKLAGQRGGR